MRVNSDGFFFSSTSRRTCRACRYNGSRERQKRDGIILYNDIMFIGTHYRDTTSSRDRSSVIEGSISSWTTPPPNGRGDYRPMHNFYTNFFILLTLKSLKNKTHSNSLTSNCPSKTWRASQHTICILSLTHAQRSKFTFSRTNHVLSLYWANTPIFLNSNWGHFVWPHVGFFTIFEFSYGFKRILK